MEIVVQNAIVMGYVQSENSQKKVYIDKIGIYLSECLDEYCS